MAGNKAGGLKAAKKNKQYYGEDFYRTIGRMGGSKSKSGGFASKLIGPDGLTGYERARVAGRKGGTTKRKVTRTLL